MMSKLKPFWAIVKARNIEYFRDRSSLGWNLVFPFVLLIGLALIFSGDGQAVYKVGLVTEGQVDAEFLETRFIKFIDYDNVEQAKLKLSQHSIDLVVNYTDGSYWVNEESPKSYLVEKVFLSQSKVFQRFSVRTQGLRYIDWVLPGVLAMNMMFSCLFGVGYVIVRYRKNSVLKRLKATPLSAFEFICAQLFSRFIIVLLMSTVVYIGCDAIFDFYMLGNYFDLLVVAAFGEVSLISLALLMACRSKSEELIGGLLNTTAWPMMMLSGVWFSLEGSSEMLKSLADFLPLTHLVTGARKIIIEGALLSDISYHLMVLAIMSVLFLFAASYLFNWDTER